MAESFYAEKTGHTSPHNRVAGFIREVSSQKSKSESSQPYFPAHFYRIQEFFNEVSKTHRKMVIMGKALQETDKQSRRGRIFNSRQKQNRHPF